MALPGLHDTHLHPAAIIEYESCNINSKGLDLEELSLFVAACLQRMSVTEGEWLAVRQWSFGEGNFPAGNYVTLRQSLDAADEAGFALHFHAIGDQSVRAAVDAIEAVTRHRGEGVFNPEERLPILDAIDAYTINGAKLLGQHELTGSLEAGKKADFIILDRDIVELAENGKASTIHEAGVLQTWFDGRLVYQSE